MSVGGGAGAFRREGVSWLGLRSNAISATSGKL